MTTASFFVTGGTLRHDTASYVERKADQELYEGLNAGEFCYVLTSRQMGKSSLMNRTAARLRREGVAVVMLDLTNIGQNLTPEQWYGGLLTRLSWQLDLEDELEAFWLDHERLGPLQRWMAAIRQVVLPALEAPGGLKVSKLEGSKVERPTASQPSNLPGTGPPTGAPPTSNLQPGAARLVIFIDEIDTVRSLPFSTDEFFAAIRGCYNLRTEDPEYARLTFCLLGVASPSDLIRDTRLTPFNIGRRIELTDFTKEEAAPMRAGLAQSSAEMPGREDNATKALLARVLYWTGGHPYLTQRLCRAVAEDRSDPKSEIRNPKLAVDRHCEALFLSTGAQDRDDNLIFIRERLLRPATNEPGDGDRAGLLDLYGKVRRGEHVPVDDTNPFVDLLRLSGATRVADDPRRFYSRDCRERGERPREREEGKGTGGTVLAHSSLGSLLGALGVLGGKSVVGRSSLVVRNRIYARVFDRHWVAQHMPDAEVRRQKMAYRRGLVRASAIATAVVAVIALLAVLAFRGKQAAEAATQRAEAETVKERRLAASLQKANTKIQVALTDAKQQRSRADQEKERANLQATLARQSATVAKMQRRIAQVRQGEAEQARRLADRQRRRAEKQTLRAKNEATKSRRRLYASQMGLALQACGAADGARAQELLVSEWLDPHKEHLRGFDWRYLWGLSQRDDTIATLRPKDGYVNAIAFSPDGKLIATSSWQKV